MNVMIWVLTFVHVIVALVLILLVLMQKSQDQGVGAAFGAGMTESVFGAGTTSALQRITIWCAAIMLASTLILAVLHAKRGAGGSGSVIDDALRNAPVTAPAAAPATTPVEPPAVAPTVPVAPEPAKP
jgi:preprotein translocase subunit SecG